jgi:hypothetical protein
VWDKGFDALQNVFIALQKLANRTQKTIKKVHQNSNKAKNLFLTHLKSFLTHSF